MKIKMFLSDKNKLTIQKGTDFLLVSAIIIFFVFLFWGINIINSGYHIIDDHEIYYFPSVINKDTVIQYFNDFILNDGRFRPLYWIHRVLLFYIFKQNFTLYYTEMFVLGMENESFEDAVRNNDFSTISKYLYRVQSISESDYWFRLHIETQNDKTPSAKLANKYHRVKSLKSFHELNPHKVYISVIGKIKAL